MFVDFDKTFHPTEEDKQKRAEYVNNLLRESLKNNGEVCCNCKNMHLTHVGLDIMLPRCNKTGEWIKEDIKCKHYEFCGFIKIGE